jgi:hypothetical protein
MAEAGRIAQLARRVSSILQTIRSGTSNFKRMRAKESVGTTLKRTPLIWITLSLLAMAVGMVALVATAGTAKAESVSPTPHDGNLTCKTLLDNDAAYEIKIDPPKSGTYGPITVTFSPDGRLVDFTSTVPVLGVFVKGGNFYDYRPGGSTQHPNPLQR